MVSDSRTVPRRCIPAFLTPNDSESVNAVSINEASVFNFDEKRCGDLSTMVEKQIPRTVSRLIARGEETAENRKVRNSSILECSIQINEEEMI